MNTLDKPLSKKAQKQQDRAQAVMRLREMLKPGDTVYTVLRHVSRSGMMRHIDLYKLTDEGPLYLTGYFATACDYRQADRGVKVGGCGMDMGFHCVYSLSRTIFPRGFGILPLGGKDMPKTGVYECPSTPERAAQMVAQGFKFRGRNGDAAGWVNDGGYALQHRWM